MVDAGIIKKKLRINHSKLDEVFTSDIDVAKTEMIRCGISQDMVEAMNEPLIDACIIAYVMWVETEDERYKHQFDLRCDELRKTSNYKGE